MSKEIEKTVSVSEAPRGALSVKRANIFFLWYAVLMIGLGSVKIPGLPMTWVALIYYIPLLVVASLLCRKEGKTILTAYGFHRVKPLTILLTIVLCMATHSISHLISSLTNLLFPSFFESASRKMLGGSFFVNFIGVAIIPAFFEEFVLRGGMLNSYSGTGRLRASVLLTAFLFGLMHMNPTQFFYAFAIGIVLGLLFVLTGSIWPGILFHFLNNGMAPISMVLEERFGTDFVQKYIFPFSRGLSDLKSALVTITAAVVGLVIVVLCLRGIARCEGSREKLRLCVRGGGTASLVTLPLIIAIVLMCLMTAAVTYSMIMSLASVPA
ncbi:MAG: CPBP family intramembrane metalloprotease [Oscillospiraceae bacterium]|nr:CPBP family intramembrane metalloprotease [Oscillospiraceae bacterium]